LIDDIVADMAERRDPQQDSRLLAAIVRCCDDAIFSVTTEGTIQSWNDAAERIYGYSAGEILGRSVKVLSPVARAHETHEILGMWKLGGEIKNLELIRRRKDGREIVIQLSISPIKDLTGKVVGASTISRDITEKRRSEVALRHSEEQYRILFDTNPIAMYIYDPTTLYIRAMNQAALRQYGFTEQEYLANKVTDIRPEEDIPAVLQDISKSSFGHQPQRGLWRHRTKNGVLIDVEIVCNHIGFQGVDAILVAAQNVTDRKRAEEMLQDSEKKYRALFEDSADAALLIDETAVLECNSAALEMFGYPALASMPHPMVMSPRNQPDGKPSRVAGEQKMAETFLNGKAAFEWLHQRKNGEVFPAEVCLTGLTLSGRQVMLATVRDITERKRAEEALLFKNALLEAQTETTTDGILAVDDSDCIILVNKHFQLGFDIPDELLDERDDQILRKHVMDKMEGPEAFIAKIKYLNSHRDEMSSDEIRLKNGTIFDRYSAPLVDSTGKYRGRIWYHRDITERKAAEERIHFLAYYDALTALPHRALLQDRVDNALADARRRGEKIAVLFLDLDHFKAINDTFGHSFGDLLLKDVAKRIQHCGREQDTVARIGGDEFVILLSSAKDAAGAAIAAQRIVAALNESFVIQGQSLKVSCSIGVSMFPEHGADSEALIRNADAAMYCAKSDGRGKVRFFTDEMNAEALERLNMDKNLRLALDKGELSLMYQPQIEIETGRIIGFEALIRWEHPEMGLVPPERFIPSAESNGLIMPIGEWVLRTACTQAKTWQDNGLAAVSMAVNVSAVQFRQQGFTALIRRVLKDTGLPAQHLELELTESLLLSNADVVFRTLQDLKEMGLQLAIDDFGTGYSSLSYLKQFPVDRLKIDRSFIRDIASDYNDAAITIAIISMAKSQNLKVIAEGVEDKAQLSFLREHHCDEMQGFYFSKPISADEAGSMQRNHGQGSLLELARGCDGVSPTVHHAMDSVRPDTRHGGHFTVPALADGRGGSDAGRADGLPERRATGPTSSRTDVNRM
jgi:diguanylate cyclase (GGDEF)-like protein/PAS domain S-box-containing protein